MEQGNMVTSYRCPLTNVHNPTSPCPFSISEEEMRKGVKAALHLSKYHNLRNKDVLIARNKGEPIKFKKTLRKIKAEAVPRKMVTSFQCPLSTVHSPTSPCPFSLSMEEMRKGVTAALHLIQYHNLSYKNVLDARNRGESVTFKKIKKEATNINANDAPGISSMMTQNLQLTDKITALNDFILNLTSS